MSQTSKAIFGSLGMTPSKVWNGNAVSPPILHAGEVDLADLPLVRFGWSLKRQVHHSFRCVPRVGASRL